MIPKHCLDLDLSMINDIVSATVYNEIDDYSFEIVNFPFLAKDVYRNIARPPLVYIFHSLLSPVGWHTRYCFNVVYLRFHPCNAEKV